MTEVKVIPQQNQIATVSGESQALMNMIERVCLDPSADINKLEKMLDMQERILDRNAKQAFSADFAAMQIALPRIVENGTGHNNIKYALLEDINDTTRPILNKYGFGTSFSIDQSTDRITVKARLYHKLGHFEEASISLASDVSGNKNAVQAVGSTISYGKRYSLCALLNISTGDDKDGASPEVHDDEMSTITSAETMEDLSKAFSTLFIKYKMNKPAQAFLTIAKDKKKKELMEQSK